MCVPSKNAEPLIKSVLVRQLTERSLSQFGLQKQEESRKESCFRHPGSSLQFSVVSGKEVKLCMSVGVGLDHGHGHLPIDQV